MHDSAAQGSTQGTNSKSLTRLLLRLHPDEAQAWERYEALRRRLVKYFEWNQCLASVDLANDVLDRVAAKLDNDEIREVDKYCFGVARFVCLEAHKKMQRETYSEDLPGGADALPGPHDESAEIVNRIEQDRRLRCLLQGLARLLPGDRELVVQYYSADGQNTASFRRELADRVGLKVSTLRVRTNRLRDQLEKWVNSCLEFRRREILSTSKRFSM